MGETWGSPGSIVTVPVTCNAIAGAVAAQVDVSFDPAVATFAGLVGGSGLAGHLVDEQLLAPGHLRALVYSTTNGLIAAGTMALVQFAIATNAPDGEMPLVLGNVILAQVNGKPVQPLALADGLLRVSFAGYLTAAGLDAGGQMIISWVGSGTLLQSTNVALPMSQWTVVPDNPTGSFTLTPATNGPQMFYRLRQ